MCNGASIGENCVVGGFVGENCRVGANSRVFGSLVHSQLDPTIDWDEIEEPAPVLGERVFVGFGALVIGGVAIQDRVYICAGATVTQDVPSRHIAFGVNQIIDFRAWKERLRHSPLFGGS